MKFFNRIVVALIIVSCTSFMRLAAFEEEMQLPREEVQQGATIIVRAENGETMILTTEDLKALQSEALTFAANQLLLPAATELLEPIIPSTKEQTFVMESIFDLPIQTLEPLKVLLLQTDLQQINFTQLEDILKLADFLIVNPYGQLFNFFQQLAEFNMPMLCELYEKKLIKNTEYLEEVLLPHVPYKLTDQLGGHDSTLWSVAISNDMKTIISGSDHHEIFAWWKMKKGEFRRADLEYTGTDYGDYYLDTDAINALKFSDDDSLLVSGEENGVVTIWKKNAETNLFQPVQRLGRLILFDAPDEDPDTEDARLNDDPALGHIKEVYAVDISQNSNTVISGSFDHTIIVWQKDLQTAQYQLQQRLGEVNNTDPTKGHTNVIPSAAISRDSNIIVSGSADNTIIVWQKDLQTGQYQLHQRLGDIDNTDAEKGHISGVKSVVISKDGNTIMSGSHDHTIIVWQKDNMGQWRLKHRFGVVNNENDTLGHVKSVSALALSEDGNTLISGSYDHTIIVWHINPKTGDWFLLQRLGEINNRFSTIGHDDQIASLALSKVGDIISGSVDQTLIIWKRNFDDFCKAHLPEISESTLEELAPPAKRARME